MQPRAWAACVSGIRGAWCAPLSIAKFTCAWLVHYALPVKERAPQRVVAQSSLHAHCTQLCHIFFCLYSASISLSTLLLSASTLSLSLLRLCFYFCLDSTSVPPRFCLVSVSPPPLTRRARVQHSRIQRSVVLGITYEQWVWKFYDILVNLVYSTYCPMQSKLLKNEDFKKSFQKIPVNFDSKH